MNEPQKMRESAKQIAERIRKGEKPDPALISNINAAREGGQATSDRPKLGGGITPAEWLRQIAEMDRKKGAHMRALEAENIADWIEKLEAKR
jgi:hypothetical protein